VGSSTHKSRIPFGGIGGRVDLGFFESIVWNDDVFTDENRWREREVDGAGEGRIVDHICMRLLPRLMSR